MIASLWIPSFVSCLLFQGLAAAANFTASVDHMEVSVGEPVQLTLRYEGVPNASQPQLPALEGFNITYGGAQTQTNVENGVSHDAIAHIFMLLPTREGTLVIPAFGVQLGSQTLASQPIAIKVTKGRAQGVRTEEMIQINLSLPRTNLFLNEMVPVDLKLLIRNGIHCRNQMQSVTGNGFSEIKLPRPVESEEVIGGKSFTVYTFRALSSPMQTGNLMLGPAQATMDVVLGDGTTRTIATTSRQVPVLVLPLPGEGKPPSFTGAVGHFALDVTASPTIVRAGEPVALTIRVVGQGNLAALAPPKFTPPEGFKSYDPAVKNRQTDEIGFTGETVFEQIIVPLSPRASVIPPVMFSFFDPETGHYQTLVRGPIRLTVREAPAGATPTVVSAPPITASPATPALRPREKLGVGIAYLKPGIGSLVSTSPSYYRQAWFLAVQGVPVLALVISFFAQRRQARLRNDIGYARARRAFSNAKVHLAEAERLMVAGQSQSSAFYAALFNTLQNYLGDRLNLPSSGITSNIVEEQLRPRGVPAEIGEALKKVFAACDTARFAPSLQGNLDRERLVNVTREAVTAMEKMAL